MVVWLSDSCAFSDVLEGWLSNKRVIRESHMFSDCCLIMNKQFNCHCYVQENDKLILLRSMIADSTDFLTVLICRELKLLDICIYQI